MALQYYIILVTKYRYKVLRGELTRDIENLMRVFSHILGCEIIKLHAQLDHVYDFDNDTTKTINIILNIGATDPKLSIYHLDFEMSQQTISE